jgi:signal transduction histidine kinase
LLTVRFSSVSAGVRIGAAVTAASAVALANLAGAVRAAEPAAPPPLPLSDQLCGPKVYDQPDNRAAVELVDAAGAQIRQKGAAALPAFRVKGSRWFQGDRYVFVLNPAGEILVYPPDPALETGNMTSAQSALQTSEGRRTGLRFLEAANSRRGCGWVHYRIPRPGQQSPQWKSTYVERFVAPNNQVFLVGSGAYDSRMEKAFAVDEVEAAAALIAKEGRQAFAQLRDPKGRFIFHDTYVFVNDTAGVELVNPAFPALEGKNLSANRDSAGQFFVRDYIRLATSQGSGWVRYQWPRPSDPGKAVTKLTYVREVKTPQGETLVVGSGLYD